MQASVPPPPSWAIAPKDRGATISCYKDGKLIKSWRVDGKPQYAFGRAGDDIDIPVDHPSVARVHALLIHHEGGRAFVVALPSESGTFLNGEKLPVREPKKLKEGFELVFGTSTRCFVYLPGGKPPAELPSKKRSHEDEEETRPAQPTSGAGPAMVSVLHLLVKHKESRNPSSWKEPTVTRTKEEALEQIKDLEHQLRNPLGPEPEPLRSRFTALATIESHCSSAKRGGELAPFGRGSMQKPFEDVAFTLKVDEMSAPVWTESGVHLILRTA
eukprot:TRINITY_DN14918_c0_g1_i1.p1 TRINITY_DN14918_c0_g1~~TRINITY_DN14918_c0_g1_i1.p1  ORF type:complete len:286 (+),score=52.25 TRINITY_DN14918_c0_g1_i1:44-859(+)